MILSQGFQSEINKLSRSFFQKPSANKDAAQSMGCAACRGNASESSLPFFFSQICLSHLGIQGGGRRLLITYQVASTTTPPHPSRQLHAIVLLPVLKLACTHTHTQIERPVIFCYMFPRGTVPPLSVCSPHHLFRSRTLLWLPLACSEVWIPPSELQTTGTQRERAGLHQVKGFTG